MNNTQLLNDLIQLKRDEWPEVTAEPRILSCRSDRLVVRMGPLVMKTHAVGTPAVELNARLELIQKGALHDIFLPPLNLHAYPIAGNRLVSLWPAARPLRANLGKVPWAAAARLLARLHQSPIPKAQLSFPRSGAIRRVQNTLSRLASLHPDSRDSAVVTVKAAAATLRFMETPAQSFVHGDWHLGQLVKRSQTWQLIDVDDFGLGDPAWDLARPAAFFAAGLLSPTDWEIFLESYREAGGPAVPRTGDPWMTLEAPARALIVQCAAVALMRSKRRKKALTEAEIPLLEACQRIIHKENSR